MEQKALGFYFKSISNNFAKNFDDWCRSKNITSTQMRILIMLKKSKSKVRQKDIEERFDLTGATVSGIISRLENRGYIVRESDLNDKRIKYIELTDEGRKALDENYSKLVQCDKMLTKNLNNEEINELYRLLIKVYENIKEEGKC